MEYIKSDKSNECIFCTLPASNNDEKNYILFKGTHSFVIMNTFPYNCAHLMVSPYRHINCITKQNESNGFRIAAMKKTPNFLKIHIKNQIDNGANVIQIFDSWAGLLEEKDLPNYIYSPTLNLVNYVKSLNTPVICFPREIKNYKEFCEIVKPDAVSIDYNVDPKKILNDIKIPIQGGGSRNFKFIF